MRSTVENRVRTAMRASRIVWWMGMLAALAAAGAVVQPFVGRNLVMATLPRVITVDDSGALVTSRAELSVGDRLLGAAPDILMSSALAASAFLLSAILVAVAGGDSFGKVTQRNLRWLPLALGLIAAAFRWVIRDGAALEREVDGVI